MTCDLSGRIAPRQRRGRNGLIGVSASSPELSGRIVELAHVRRRFGYRRLHILLAREGFRLNHKRLFRIYREERLPRASQRAQAGHRHA